MARQALDALKTGLPPVAGSDSRLLILGSLPGDESLRASRYYAHPTNQFWRLLGGAMKEELQSLDYEARLRRLAERRVGLWDVIASATRPGSLDQSIRTAEHNQLAQFILDRPEIEAIGFNGKTAASIGRKSLGNLAGRFDLIDLPSSSAANTTPFEAKASAWSQLGKYLGR